MKRQPRGSRWKSQAGFGQNGGRKGGTAARYGKSRATYNLRGTTIEE